MIKLIASDVDGTLVSEGSDRINPEIFSVIRRLKEQGTLFAVASGRSYSSIRKLFEPVAQDMIFIADNGSNIICRGYETFSAKIDPETIGELVRYIRENRLGYPVISSKTTVFVETEDPEFLDLMINGYHNHVRVMKDVLEADETIIKAAIFRRPNIRDIAQKVTEDWKDRLHVMAAGDPWLDFVDYQADKGYALKSIQKLLGIKREETMAFGDNLNDLGMLESAGESYAVANARPQVRQAAKHLAGAYTEDGVLKVMKGLLENASM